MGWHPDRHRSRHPEGIVFPGGSLALAAVVALVGLGCATSLISDGELRPERFEQIVVRAERARGLRAQRPIDARLVHREKLPQLLEEVLLAELGPDRIRSYEEGLVTIGIWPPETPLVDELLDVMRSELAGFYVPDRATLYLVVDPRVPASVRVISAVSGRDLVQELTLAHEVVHLLQHQAHPELFVRDDFFDQDDVAIAVEAALEGDATTFGYRAMGARNLQPISPEQFERQMMRGAAAALAERPALIRMTLAFPYARGYAMSLAEHAALLEVPPISTEQVLHPDRRDDPFEAIDLRGLRSHLPAGCDFVHENSLGELGISVLLRDLAQDEPDAAAWMGWNGDRYLAAACDGSREFLWLTSWDEDDDAREFAEGYAQILVALAQRAQLGGEPTVRLRGRDVTISTPALTPHADGLAARALRTLVSDLDELFAHYR